MPLDAQVVNGLRIVAHSHINGDVSEILANDVEDFCDYLEQHGGTATTTKLFRMPPKIEVMAGSDQPGATKGPQCFIESHVAKTINKARRIWRLRMVVHQLDGPFSGQKDLCARNLITIWESCPKRKLA